MTVNRRTNFPCTGKVCFVSNPQDIKVCIVGTRHGQELSGLTPMNVFPVHCQFNAPLGLYQAFPGNAVVPLPVRQGYQQTRQRERCERVKTVVGLRDSQLLAARSLRPTIPLL